tara:strand:+ start:8816 stop:9556 length:741 start_codon:yes stop_codon:yes gene_type:complete
MHVLFQRVLNLSNMTSYDVALTHLNSLWQFQCIQPELDDFITLEMCLNDLTWLKKQVAQLKKKQCAPRDRVAASLLHKKLTKQVVIPLMVYYLMTSKVPQFSYQDLHVCKNFTHLMRWSGQIEHTTQQDFYTLLQQLLLDLHQIFTQHLNLSNAIFWTNTALFMTQPWTKLSQKTEDHQALLHEFQTFLQKVDKRLVQRIHWLSLQQDEQWVLQPRRMTCCLKYTTAIGKFCRTCPTGCYKDVPTL